MLRPRSLPMLVLLSIVSLVAAAPAGAELATWDQARVTEIAGELAKAANAWQLAVREQPGLTEVGSGDAQQGFGLVQKAQALQVQSQSLADHLAAGKGYDKTHNEYRDLKEMMDDIEVQAQQAELDEPTMDAWSKVVSLQRQIAPYYDPKALDESSGSSD